MHRTRMIRIYMTMREHMMLHIREYDMGSQLDLHTMACMYNARLIDSLPQMPAGSDNEPKKYGNRAGVLILRYSCFQFQWNTE